MSSISETTTVYNPVLSNQNPSSENIDIKIIPVSASDLIAIQVKGLNPNDIDLSLFDLQGMMISQTTIEKGQTIAYFDIQTLYAGTYFIQIKYGNHVQTEKLVLQK